MTMKLRFKKLSPTARTPLRAHATDAGLDLYADQAELLPDYQVRYKSNIAFEIPEGHVGLLFPRSSVYRTGQLLSNAVGVLDADYRGSVDAVFLGNNTDKMYKVGDRFAQLVIVPIPTVELEEAEELSETERGAGGYGSTGR